MFKTIYCVGIAILACFVASLFWPQPRSQTKSSRKELLAAKSALDKESAQEERQWQPVAAAMAAGDVARTKRVFATFAAQDFPIYYDSTRETLARFYAAHGDASDAKKQLDPIVYFEPMKIRGKSLQRLNYDPKDYDLWLQVSPGVSAADRERALLAWENGYRKQGHGLKPNAFPEMGPLALLEFSIGQEYLEDSTTYKEALKHYRRAVALAPTSLTAMKHLVLALRFNGQLQEAKVDAVRASLMTSKPSERAGILWGAHVTTAEAKQIAASL